MEISLSALCTDFSLDIFNNIEFLVHPMLTFDIPAACNSFTKFADHHFTYLSSVVNDLASRMAVASSLAGIRIIPLETASLTIGSATTFPLIVITIL